MLRLQQCDNISFSFNYVSNYRSTFLEPTCYIYADHLYGQTLIVHSQILPITNIIRNPLIPGADFSAYPKLSLQLGCSLLDSNIHLYDPFIRLYQSCLTYNLACNYNYFQTTKIPSHSARNLMTYTNHNHKSYEDV